MFGVFDHRRLASNHVHDPPDVDELFIEVDIGPAQAAESLPTKTGERRRRYEHIQIGVRIPGCRDQRLDILARRSRSAPLRR